jgi:hypothetical protein
METKEKEIYSSLNSKKKNDNLKSEYSNLQGILLSELFKKLIRYITPVEYKIFSNKLIKMKEFDANDSIESIIEKVNENQEMYVNY